ncbi:MAG: hypothetical protein EXR51_10980 [Dehalococcoidia bacterium]|nr:hypothetical protein [Dehalococcoidia bacterium]
MHIDEARQRGNDLLRYASRWWAGEAEVVHTFFSRTRTPGEHLRWLRMQAFKELQPKPEGLIERLVLQLKDGFYTLEEKTNRTEYLETIDFLLEEFRHYVLFADVIDAITGSKLTTEELAGYEVPEETRLAAMRRDYIQKHGQLARAASSFCEGGGASLFYEGMQISGDPVSDSIAAACRSVYEDEMDHAHHGVEMMVQAASTEEDWKLAEEMVAAISRQRLRMRNQQFGFPLGEARLAEIAEGKIEVPARFQALLV